jgi:type IV secretory pathway VirB10-like protein
MGLSRKEGEAMVRLAITISVFTLLACGGSDTAQTGDAGDVPPVEAAAVEQADIPAVPMPTEPMPAATAAPEVQSCLDLIRQSEFQQALPVCLAALAIDPDNQQVQDAVAQAREETAKLAAAEAVDEAAAEGAAEEAASQLDEATGGLAEELGR